METTRVPDVEATATDQCVVVRHMPWSQFEAFLRIKGDDAAPRIAYLDGDLSLMSPSQEHEFIGETLGRLIEAYADELGIDLWSLGSWTLKRPRKKAGAEPDKSYIVRERGTKKVPDLAIEVIWTSRDIDKEEIYRRLGVGELWFWEDAKITVRRLKGEVYKTATRSGLFPKLDLALVAKLATRANPSQAVRELRARVKKKSR